MKRQSSIIIGLLTAIVAFVPIASAQDKAPSGPLAALPSQPGTHIEKIKLLGDNEWVNLGAPAADPKWGKARGSAWGAKALILAPDLRGAFLFGEGVHGFVKPDGHAMDDLWFYDINAHRWICLYPGMNPKTFNQRVRDQEITIDDAGILREKDGWALPMHTSIHAWGNLAYDSDRRKFVFLSGLGGNGVSTNPESTRYFLGGWQQMDEGLKLLEEKLKTSHPPTTYSPWSYDVATGKFERAPATGARPAGGFPQLHYLATAKQFLAVGSNTVTHFDPVKGHWTDLKPQGPEPKGWDAPGCYDSKRNRVYRNDGDGSKSEGLMAYDIATNTWSHLKPKGDGPEAMNTNGAFYEYDPLFDIVVVIQMKGSTPGIHVYHPQTNSWAAPLRFPADGPKFRFAANTIFDRELNAYFCHLADDSADNGVVWVYRLKKRSQGDRRKETRG